MISSSKLKHGLLHLLDTIGIRKPPFGPVTVGVLAEDALIAVHRPGAHSDDRAARDGMAADRGTGWWHDALVVEAEDGVNTLSFLDAGAEVGQGVGLAKFGHTKGVGWVFGREMRVELLL